MKKFLKITAIIAVVVILLVGIAVATVPLWFPIDKVKDIVVEKMSEKTGRSVVVKELKFNIFKGIELHGVSISENKIYKTNTPFLKDDLIILKYNLFALLAKKLVIHNFQMVSPYVQIYKEKGGTFNFSDILESMAKPADAETQAKKPSASAKATADKKSKKPDKLEKSAADKKKKKKPAFDLIVTSVSIKDGNFKYIDRSKTKTLSLKLENFNFGIENVVLSAVKPIGISMDCIVHVNQYAIPVLLKAKLKADLKNKKAQLSINPFKIGDINTTGNIAIVDFKDVKGSIVTTMNSSDVLKFLDPATVKKVQDIKMDIPIKNTAKFTMINNKLKFKDTFTIDNGKFEYKKKKVVENFKGKATFADDYKLDSNFDFLLAGQKVNIKMKATDVDDMEQSAVNIDIYSPKFAAEYLLAMFPKKSKEEKAAAKKKKEVAKAEKAKNTPKSKKKKSIKTPGVYLTLNADSIFYKEVNAGKTSLNARFVDNKLYSELAINAYKGLLTNNLVADVIKETFTVDTKIKNVNVHQLIDDAVTVMPDKNPNKKSILEDMQNNVYGMMNLNAKLSGTTFRDVSHTIKGKGSVLVKNGSVKPLDVGQNISKQFGVKFLENDIQFTEMGTDFDMAKGKIDIKNLRILNGPNGNKGDIKIRGKGYITVDKVLDMAFKTDLSPAVAKDVEASFARRFGIMDASYAYNTDGWLPFDFRVYGTTKAKKYDYNQKRMLDNAKRNLSKKVEKEGAKFLEKEGSKLLKNLFGK